MRVLFGPETHRLGIDIRHEKTCAGPSRLEIASQMIQAANTPGKPSMKRRRRYTTKDPSLHIFSSLCLMGYVRRQGGSQ